MSNQRGKTVDVRLILLSDKSPWNTVEEEDMGLKKNEVVLCFKSDPSQEYR